MESKAKSAVPARAGAIFIVILVVLGFAVGSDAMAKYEEPNYQIKRKSNDIEIRQYPPVIAAEVEVSTAQKQPENQAFRILAGYIFGKNVARDKIAMTVPVTETSASEKVAMTVPVTSVNADGTMIMRFYMPSKYTLESLPEAVDKRIKFTKVPAKSYAVIRFSGAARDKNIDQHEEKLRDYMKDQGLSAQGPAIRAFYNPPWTLPFLRRNEIWLPIEPQP